MATNVGSTVVGVDAKRGMPAGDCATTDATEAMGSVLVQGMETEDVSAVKSEDTGSVVVACK